MRDLLIFCHVDDPAAQDVLSLARNAFELAKAHGLRLRALAICEALDQKNIDALAACGCEIVDHLALSPAPETYDGVAEPAAKLIRSIAPEIVLFSAKPKTRLLAAQIAALLSTGLTADCCDLSIENDLLVQTRPAFGGNLLASIVCPEARPQMATVHPFALPSLPPLTEYPAAQVTEHRADIRPVVSRLSQTLGGDNTLSRANIVLCGGNGLDAEDFALLSRICDKTGAAMGATRVAVNDGRAPYRCQIGQTGVGIQADVYVGFGVSGAVQHIAGMKRCRTIIAVNLDPKAPIADYCDRLICADAKNILRRIAFALAI